MQRQIVGAVLAGAGVVVAALQGLVAEPSSPGGWVIFGVLAVAGGGVAAGGVRTQAPPSLDPPEPAPVRDWIVDREERRQAEEAVCGTRATVGLTTSLSGAGGFGKTTLAGMICASPRVRQRYKGGVYSFAIGREVRGRAEIAARVAEITRFITGDTEQFSDPTGLAGIWAGCWTNASEPCSSSTTSGRTNSSNRSSKVARTAYV